MKIYWAYFTDTTYWENELCVRIYAHNGHEAVIFLNEWIKKMPNDFFDGIDTSNINIMGGEELKYGIVGHSWEE